MRSSLLLSTLCGAVVFGVLISTPSTLVANQTTTSTGTTELVATADTSMDHKSMAHKEMKEAKEMKHKAKKKASKKIVHESKVDHKMKAKEHTKPATPEAMMEKDE